MKLQAEMIIRKLMAFRLLFERHKEVFKRLRMKEPATYKYINETNHIENDYVFQLDPMKFYSIPTYYLQKLTEAIMKFKMYNIGFKMSILMDIGNCY